MLSMLAPRRFPEYSPRKRGGGAARITQSPYTSSFGGVTESKVVRDGASHDSTHLALKGQARRGTHDKERGLT